MSTAVARLAARTAGHWPLAVGIAMLLGIEALLPILGWLIPVEPLLRGWLVAFAMFSCVPIGSMTWMMIHRLTGGEWGRAAAPVLRPAAAMSPVVILLFIPVLVGTASHLSLGGRFYPDPGRRRALVSQWTVVSDPRG